jgi:hypothetical protein
MIRNKRDVTDDVIADDNVVINILLIFIALSIDFMNKQVNSEIIIV